MGFLKKLARAVVGAAASFVLFGWIGSAIILGVVALKKLKKWLTPDMPDKQALLIQRMGSDFAIPVVYGTRKVGAIVVDRAIDNEPGGLENENYHVLCVFCYGEIDGYVEFFFNGISWNDPRWTKNGLVYFNYQTATGTPEQNPLTRGSVFNRWDPVLSHYRGLATAIFTFRQDKDSTIWNGEPQITAIIRGKKCLNPNNLSAPAVYTENPSWHLYDYIRSTVYGLGLADSDIDLASFISVASIADTPESAVVNTQSCSIVDGVYVCTGSETETVNFKRFSHNNIIDTDRTLFDNVAEIANSFRGFFPDSDGRIKIGTEIEGDSVFSFNADNIVSSITSSQPGIKDRSNRVVVRFPNIANKYEMDECFYPAVDDPLYAQWLAEDNGLNLEKTITAEYTVYKAEALQLAEVAAKSSRNAELVQFTSEAEAIQCDVGDIVDITEENRGWIGKLFRIASIEYREDFLINITAIQHDDAIYPWSDLDYSEIIGGTNLGDPANIPAVTGLTITPDSTGVTSGRLSWNYEANAFVRRFLVGVDVLESSYTLTADIASGTLIIPVSPSPRGEFTGDPLTIGEQTYIIASTQIGQFTLQSVTTEAYTTGQLAVTNYPSNLFKAESVGQTYDLPLLPPNSYTANVVAVSTIGATSPNAAISFDLVTPVPPTSLTIIASNFELTVIPVLAGSSGLGTQFEFAIGSTTEIRGRGRSIIFAGLLHGTAYTIYCRTINALGVSAWMFAVGTTTSDATDIVDLIGADIADQIFDDVVAEVSDNLETIVDAALVDYPTTIEVNQLITDRIDEVNQIIGEDPRVTIAAIMDNALANFETGEDLETETKERITVTTEIQASVGENAAAIEETNQVVADLDSATATSISTLTAATGANTASITNLQQTVTDLESATSTDITALQSQVNGNTAELIIVNQTIVDLDSATSTSISNLNAQFDTLQEDVDGVTTRVTEAEADIITNSTAISTETSARVIQYNGLNARLTTTETDVADAEDRITVNEASIINLDDAIASEASTRATQISTLSARVTTTEDDIEGIDTELTAQIGRIDEVEIDGNNNASAISALTATVNNSTTGLSATFTLASQAKTTADGAALSATNLTNTVNNPTTGLAATNTLATLAKTTADGAATAASTVTGTVNNPTTGLSATYTIANAAKTTADGAASSATTIANTVYDPDTGLGATAIIANGAKTTADGNTIAISGLQTQVTGIDGELSSAQLILESTVDELGDVSSRAFLGVSSVTGGVATTTGLVVDGATNTLEFRADTLRVSDTSGVVQLYWDSTRNKWIYKGDLVAGTFQTALTGYRAEMSGVGDYPIWYGVGTGKTYNDASFLVDKFGNVKMANATMFNCNIQGSLVTDNGSGIRTELYDDGTYLFWAGTGTKNDANGIFWFKRDGTGFIKGEFFQGQIIESKTATDSETNSANLLATIAAHNSAGKPIDTNVNGFIQCSAPGVQTSKVLRANVVVTRDGATILAYQRIANGVYDAEFATTQWFVDYPGFVTGTYGTGDKSFSLAVTYTFSENPTGALTVTNNSCTLRTFENKLA